MDRFSSIIILVLMILAHIFDDCVLEHRLTTKKNHPDMETIHREDYIYAYTGFRWAALVMAPYTIYQYWIVGNRNENFYIALFIGFIVNAAIHDIQDIVEDDLPLDGIGEVVYEQMQHFCQRLITWMFFIF